MRFAVSVPLKCGFMCGLRFLGLLIAVCVFAVYVGAVSAPFFVRVAVSAKNPLFGSKF